MSTTAEHFSEQAKTEKDALLARIIDGNTDAAIPAILFEENFGEERTLRLCQRLDEMGIRGEKLACVFKDFCNDDFDIFAAAVEEKSSRMLTFIKDRFGVPKTDTPEAPAEDMPKLEAVA